MPIEIAIPEERTLPNYRSTADVDAGINNLPVFPSILALEHPCPGAGTKRLRTLWI